MMMLLLMMFDASDSLMAPATREALDKFQQEFVSGDGEGFGGRKRVVRCELPVFG